MTQNNNTQGTTTSTTYTPTLTGGGTNPSVTLTTGTRAMVIVTGFVYAPLAGESSYMSFAVSGATTQAATDARAVAFKAYSGPNTPPSSQASTVTVITNLTAGSNTFTAQYRSTNSGNTATFANRTISVIPLG